MRKGLIGLAMFGLLFIALMLFAPRPKGGDDPPKWTEALGRLLGGWAPRVRDLGGKTAFTMAALEVHEAEVPAAPGRDLRLLTLRHQDGGNAVVTFVCRPTPAQNCDPPEAVACLGLPLDPACGPQIEMRDHGEEISFTVGPGGGRITVEAQMPLRFQVVQ